MKEKDNLFFAFFSGKHTFPGVVPKNHSPHL